MNTDLKLRKIGNSVGVILPKEYQHALNVQEGDVLHAVLESAALKLSTLDPDFAEAMEAYKAGSRQYRNTLHELAK